MRIPLTSFDVFRPIRVNVPTLRKLKGNLQHCFVVLGEMADAKNDAMFHKGKKIQKYSLAFKKEVIAYAEARGNRPASKRFSIDETRVREWRAQKNNIEGLLGSTKGKQRSKLSGGGRKPLSAKLAELLLEWIENRRTRELLVSCKLIMKKAEVTYRDMTVNNLVDNDDFKVAYYSFIRIQVVYTLTKLKLNNFCISILITNKNPHMRPLLL